MQRILAVDYGRRRMGLAVSDPLGVTAQGIGTLEVSSRKEALEELCKLVRELRAGEVLIGLPLRTDGSEGPEAEEVRSFGEELSAWAGVRVVFRDERFTSQEAMRVLHQMGRKLKGRKKDLDRLSATLLLQRYLEERRKHGTR